jgi:hypothetical protein
MKMRPMVDNWVVYLITIICSCSFLACDEDSSDTNGTGGTESSCERHAKIIAEAAAEACEAKDSECCYCKCYNDNRKEFDYPEYSTNDNCVCVNPASVTDGGVNDCSGFSLSEAESCLSDVEACKSDFFSKTQTGCAMSPLK